MRIPPRRGLLLRHRDFRLLWCGETAGKFGAAVTSVAIPLIAVDRLDASTFEVGMLTAAAWLPWLLIGLPAGVWVDRLPRRGVMLASAAASLLLYTSLPVAAWLGLLTIWLLLGVALLAGTAAVFFQTAYTAYLPGLLEPADQAEGNAKLHGSASAAQLVGLGSGGVIAQAAGAVNGMLVNAGTFAVSLLCLGRIRHREPATPHPDRDAHTMSADTNRAQTTSADTNCAHTTSADTNRARTISSGTERRACTISPDTNRRPRTMSADIREGLALIAHDPWLRTLSLFSAASNLALMGYQAIRVVFLVRTVGLSSGAVGALVAVASAGGILGAFLARRVADRFGTARATLVFELGFALAGLLAPAAFPGPGTALFVAGGFFVVAGVVGGNVVKAGFHQRYCPPDLLGRITATSSFLGYATIPLGALLGGTLGELFGPRPAMWLTCAAIPLSAVILLCSPLSHTRDLPTEPPQRAADVPVAGLRETTAADSSR
ncbi:MFS transporter [Yinghuangia seranimata]|uniref:MFS transporter n=1 Tax=Yinghuangia seranimata TaxID=408067 RepID=UPI00248AC662|nr:MFS transporter [Yinghuangia seranimata]MDI2131584.1 MFS transporter [Yinghuangia seranimata]